MTDPSTPPPVAQYRLSLFGAPALVGADADTSLGTHGHHRRRLALLAVLGAAGERGRSRDQLLMLFWPDATQVRARHSLDQLLYALRGSLGESLFDGVNPVRLNPDVVSVDVSAFDAALERGDFEAAVAEYRGPFLDGFYVDGAPEFEQWTESERARLAARHAGALERLARHASSAEDHERAVRWWKALAEVDPVSGKYAAGLVAALISTGDHAAALQYAKRHEALVARELGIAASPAIAGLIDELRAKMPSEVRSGLTPTAEKRAARVVAPRATTVDDAVRPVTTRGRGWSRRPAGYVALGAVALLLVVGISLAKRRQLAAQPAVIPRGSTTNIAAYELYLRGSDPTLNRSDSAVRAGLEYFRRAIALDPGYANAYAGVARMHMRLAGTDDDSMPVRERLALAEQAAHRGVTLDDSAADAHAALGLIRRRNYDLAGAETELRRAASLQPTDPHFREWLAQLYLARGRPQDALVEAQHSQELDPLSPTASAEVAHALIANDRCDEALAQLARLKLLRPPLLRAGGYAAECYARRKMWPEAIKEMQRIASNAGSRSSGLLGYMLARDGRVAEARQLLATLLERERRHGGRTFEVAMVYAGLGDIDQAFAWLDKSIDDRSFSFDETIVLDGLRRDPRFVPFRHRLDAQSR